MLTDFLYGTEIIEPKEHFLTWDSDLLDLKGDKKILQLKDHQFRILKPIELLKEELRREVSSYSTKPALQSFHSRPIDSKIFPK